MLSPLLNNIAQNATNEVATAGIKPSSAAPNPVISFATNHISTRPVPTIPKTAAALFGSLAG